MRSPVGTVAVNCELLTNAVEIAVPFHCTTELEMKFEPFAVSMTTLVPPAVTLVGEIEVNTGAGLGIAVVITFRVYECGPPPEVLLVFMAVGCNPAPGEVAEAIRMTVRVVEDAPPAIGACVVQLTVKLVLPLQSQPVPPLPFDEYVSPDAEVIVKVTVVGADVAVFPVFCTTKVSMPVIPWTIVTLCVLVGVNSRSTLLCPPPPPP